MKRRGLYLVTADRVCTIVDVKMIVAVQLQLVETKHESLEDTMRLKGDGAVEILLELRNQNSPVYFSVEISHIVLLAHVAYLICKCIDREIKLLEVRQLRVSFNFFQFSCVILFNQLRFNLHYPILFLILYYIVLYNIVLQYNINLILHYNTILCNIVHILFNMVI